MKQRPLKDIWWNYSVLCLVPDLICQSWLHFLHSKEFLIISGHLKIGKGHQNEKNREPGRYFGSQNKVNWKTSKYYLIL